MSIATALSIILIAFSIIFYIYYLAKRKQKVAKLFEPKSLLVFLLLSFTFLGLWQFMMYREYHNIMYATHNYSRHYIKSIENHAYLEGRLFFYINKYADNEDINSYESWFQDIQKDLAHDAEFTMLLITNKKNEVVFQHNQKTTLQHYFKKSLPSLRPYLHKDNQKKFHIMPAIKFAKDIYASWFIYPVNQKYTVLLLYNYIGLFEEIAQQEGFHNINITWISPYNNNYFVYNSNDSLGKYWNHSVEFNLFNFPFKFIISPDKQAISPYLPIISFIILFFGLGLAVIASLLMRLWHSFIKQKNAKDSIIDSASDGIFGLDRHGNVIFINDTAARLLGYDKSELFHKNMHSMIHNHDKTGKKILLSQCPIHQSLIGNGPKEIQDDIFWKKDNTYIPVEYKCVPLKSNKKNEVGVTVTFKDISQRQHMLKKLEDKSKALEASNKELEAFCYSVSHDLRAPLRHIGGFIDLLMQDTTNKLSDESKRYVDIVRNSALKLGSLIDDLLTYSRVGRFELNKEKIDLNLLISDLLEEFSTEIKDRNIEFNYENMPQIYGDSGMIRLVFSNLLSNAIKFTRNKSHAIININHKLEDEFHVFSVADNGCGFEQKYADKLFEVFQRLHKATDYEGTGVGLANVAKIIRRHGGSVSAIGEPNKGTTIFFTIPIT